MSEVKSIVAVAAVILVILSAATLAAYRYAKGRTGTIVLPGGVTYLGPSPAQEIAPFLAGSTIPIASDAPWTSFTGKLFPYSFSYPSSLSLGVFPGDPFDSVTIFWGRTNPQENLLLRVEDLSKLPNLADSIKKSKKEYAQNWWKQYTYKGVTSVTQFTNSRGLTGYRAKYTEATGQGALDNIFFEVPGRPDLVIWMASRLLAPPVFDKIVDSVSWR